MSRMGLAIIHSCSPFHACRGCAKLSDLFLNHKWSREPLEEIGKILPAVFKRHVRQSESALVELLAPLWPRLVGKAIARQSWPAAFEAGTLRVVTSCPTWAAQLRQLAEEIRAEINYHLGEPVVKKLRVRYEPMAARGGPSAVQPSPPAPAVLPGERLDGAAGLEPELSGVLQRSFSKYFSRSGRKVHSWH